MFKTKIEEQTTIQESSVPFNSETKFLSTLDTFDKEIDGIRYIVAYHAPSCAFIGIMENTLNKTVSNLQVKIQLSNEAELGPTKPEELLPGELKKITLLAYGQFFSSWNIIVQN